MYNIALFFFHVTNTNLDEMYLFVSSLTGIDSRDLNCYQKPLGAKIKQSSRSALTNSGWSLWSEAKESKKIKCSLRGIWSPWLAPEETFCLLSPPILSLLFHHAVPITAEVKICSHSFCQWLQCSYISGGFWGRSKSAGVFPWCSVDILVSVQT